VSKLTQYMLLKASEHWGDLEIKHYKDSNYEPLMPILQQEFPNWSSKKIKAYVDLSNNKAPGIAGVLAAKNTSGYYVGCLIYTFQQIDSETFNYPEHVNSKKNLNILVVENINSCIPILQKKIFLALIEESINMAEFHDCDYLELPTLATEHYELIREKYKAQIQDPRSFRTYIKLSKSLALSVDDFL